MSDYELHLKIKNAPFLRCMRQAGFKTASALAKAIGVHPTLTCDIANLKISAYKKNGAFREPILKIAKALCVHPGELFPESHLYEPMKNNAFTAEITKEQAGLLATTASQDPALILEILETETRDPFEEMIAAANLLPRHERVLRGRIKEGLTLEALSKELGISGNRVRRIEAKALRIMRQPKYISEVLEAAGTYGKGYGEDQ